MVVAVVADEVAVVGNPPGAVGIRLRPSALDEERGPDVEPGEGLEEARLGARRPSVGRGAPRRTSARRGTGAAATPYLSIPVMTIPRMNTRWKMKNRMTGMIRVMMLPAWISVVSEK